MNSEDRIEREILLKAPLSRVWRALADAEEFGDWFGAANGVAGIPAAWRERLKKREEINALIERIVARAA